MFKRLLVPLDGSRLAEAAIPAAHLLAQKAGASVALLHIIEKDAPTQIHGERHLTNIDEATAYLAEAAQRFPPDIPVECHVHTLETANVARGIADKSPFAAAAVKWADKDPEGWTPAMMNEGADYVINAATLPTASPDFKAQAWAILQTRPASGIFAKAFFKSYRATLPKPEQLVATQRQKDILLATPNRTDRQNAWLAEVSADLVAMQLDQR